jgi:hypothetical protein
MTGPEFAFEVRPQVLAGYAESLRARAADLASAGEAVAAVRVERGWFGKLPQAGFLADRYAAHQREVLAEAGELVAWLAAATAGLAECAGRYSAADRVVAGAAGAVEAALGVGIEIPGPAHGDGSEEAVSEASDGSNVEAGG